MSPPVHAPGLLDWALLARRLPGYHLAGDAGAGALGSTLSGIAVPSAELLDDLNAHDARLAALDVLIVEAFCRCRSVPLPPDAVERLKAAMWAVATRLGIPPILTYPLYIRANPTDLDSIRRFTPADEEFRFIRMHHLIEDRFDQIIAGLEAVLDAPDPDVALRLAVDELVDDFRVVNRTMAAFRSPQRMRREAFVDGFRPYFGPAERGLVTLEGPSGLQSPTFRLIAMLIGYVDGMFELNSLEAGKYNEPKVREALSAASAGRDHGRWLTAFEDRWLGRAPLPHLHPDFGAHVPALVELALADELVSSDILAELTAAGIVLGEWPMKPAEPSCYLGGREEMESPELERPAKSISLRSLPAGAQAALRAAVRLEAALFAFHVEHVTTTAYQIGYQSGTGGTAGVEFLLIALFRRGLPRVWESGLGAQFAAAATAEPSRQGVGGP